MADMTGRVSKARDSLFNGRNFSSSRHTDVGYFEKLTSSYLSKVPPGSLKSDMEALLPQIRTTFDHQFRNTELLSLFNMIFNLCRTLTPQDRESLITETLNFIMSSYDYSQSDRLPLLRLLNHFVESNLDNETFRRKVESIVMSGRYELNGRIILVLEAGRSQELIHHIHRDSEEIEYLVAPLVEFVSRTHAREAHLMTRELDSFKKDSWESMATEIRHSFDYARAMGNMHLARPYITRLLNLANRQIPSLLTGRKMTSMQYWIPVLLKDLSSDDTTLLTSEAFRAFSLFGSLESVPARLRELLKQGEIPSVSMIFEVAGPKIAPYSLPPAAEPKVPTAEPSAVAAPPSPEPEESLPQSIRDLAPRLNSENRAFIRDLFHRGVFVDGDAETQYFFDKIRAMLHSGSTEIDHADRFLNDMFSAIREGGYDRIYLIQDFHGSELTLGGIRDPLLDGFCLRLGSAVVPAKDREVFQTHHYLRLAKRDLTAQLQRSELGTLLMGGGSLHSVRDIQFDSETISRILANRSLGSRLVEELTFLFARIIGLEHREAELRAGVDLTNQAVQRESSRRLSAKLNAAGIHHEAGAMEAFLSKGFTNMSRVERSLKEIRRLSRQIFRSARTLKLLRKTLRAQPIASAQDYQYTAMRAFHHIASTDVIEQNMELLLRRSLSQISARAMAIPRADRTSHADLSRDLISMIRFMMTELFLENHTPLPEFITQIQGSRTTVIAEIRRRLESFGLASEISEDFAEVIGSEIDHLNRDSFHVWEEGLASRAPKKDKCTLKFEQKIAETEEVKRRTTQRDISQILSGLDSDGASLMVSHNREGHLSSSVVRRSVSPLDLFRADVTFARQTRDQLMITREPGATPRAPSRYSVFLSHATATSLGLHFGIGGALLSAGIQLEAGVGQGYGYRLQFNSEEELTRFLTDAFLEHISMKSLLSAEMIIPDSAKTRSARATAYAGVGGAPQDRAPQRRVIARPKFVFTVERACTMHRAEDDRTVTTTKERVGTMTFGGHLKARETEAVLAELGPKSTYELAANVHESRSVSRQAGQVVRARKTLTVSADFDKILRLTEERRTAVKLGVLSRIFPDSLSDLRYKNPQLYQRLEALARERDHQQFRVVYDLKQDIALRMQNLPAIEQERLLDDPTSYEPVEIVAQALQETRQRHGLGLSFAGGSDVLAAGIARETRVPLAAAS